MSTCEVMTSQVESTRLTQCTLLYENEQFESRISQWRLLEFMFNNIYNATYDPFQPTVAPPRPPTKAFFHPLNIDRIFCIMYGKIW